MGLGALRNAIRPLARTVLARRMLHFPAISGTPAAPTTKFRWVFGSPQQLAPWVLVPSGFHSLTDTRFPKRRPSDKPRRKRASLRPPGPYAWVQYTPGEPIPVSRPNEGSVKGRNQKKRMRLRRAFILDLKTGMKIGGGYEAGELYYLDGGGPKVALQSSLIPLQWHYRLGHPSLKALKLLIPSLSSIVGL